MSSEIEQNLIAAQEKIKELTDLLAKATAFDLGDGLIVKRCVVNSDKWVVYRDEWQVLDDSGKWIYQPSRRHHWTDEFLNRTRFETLQQALAAAEAARERSLPLNKLS